MKVAKGKWGHMNADKKKRIAITAFLFFVPLLIFFTGWIYFKTRMTVWTVIAVVGCLPACKSMVSLILLIPQKSIPESEYLEIKEHAKNLTIAYELFVTGYEKNTYLDAVAVCGNTIAAYSSQDKTDAAFAENHIQKIIRGNGFKVTVKIFKNKSQFLERLDSLYDHQDSLQEGIKFTPDSTYPELSRNEYIKHLILAISL
ncbi:MAG: hypothetical protein PHC41_02040 [Lachnospiraceae bacterium]|nr:hypothetical protein [Lachnospiraceae bacterium]MDD3614991.1 hypothetical protein [Lachnospiraceae bacterium]